MKHITLLMLAIIVMVAAVHAQSQPATAGSGETDGRNLGGYQTEQSVELGYRWVDVNGSDAIYNTFIDQHQGPRVLEQSLSMRSNQHIGSVFDDLQISSFGWGGDPENVARARVTKYHWYDFTALFRRDQYTFNYDLFANPLNPPTATPNVPVNFSPHAWETRRRMYDFGLTLLPDSKFTIRAGFSRNRNEGPSYSSFHEGTDVLLDQAWNITQNAMRFGFDYKGLKNTRISYDQFVSWDKNDTGYFLAPFFHAPLNGTNVEFGLPINPAAGAPCANPVLPDGTANPSCNGYYSYDRYQRVRTTTPTERLSFASNFKRVSFTGSASYSAGDMETPYSENFLGLVTRTRERAFTFGGPAMARRVAMTADFGVSVALTDSISLNDTMRYDNWRIPGNWNSVETATVGATTPTTLLTPLGTTTGDSVAYFLFEGQRSFDNLFRIEYSATKHFGVSVGYRLRHRTVRKGEPEPVEGEGGPEAFEGDIITINEHGPLLKVWMRPIDSLLINAEVEATMADNMITRITPRHRQQVRGRVRYKPVKWANFSASTSFDESSNGQWDTQFQHHYRNAGFVATLLPSDRLNIDLSYDYTDALQNAYICYNGTYNPAGTIANGCPAWTSATNSTNPNPNWIFSDYGNNTHYFSGTVMFKPVKILTANVGYGVTKNNGNETLLNALEPL